MHKCVEAVFFNLVYTIIIPVLNGIIKAIVLTFKVLFIEMFLLKTTSRLVIYSYVLVH